MPVKGLKSLLTAIPVMIAAGVLGNWYLSEYRKARLAGRPWYRAYLTIPGVLIIVIIILVPVLSKYLKAH